MKAGATFVKRLEVDAKTRTIEGKTLDTRSYFAGEMISTERHCLQRNGGAKGS